MKLVKERMTSMQVLFVTAAYVQGSTLLTTVIMPIQKQDTWLGVITAYLLSLIMLFVYLSLLSKYPGKNLVEINQSVYGKVIGSLVSWLYLLYIFFVLTLNIDHEKIFIASQILFDTPGPVITLLFVVPCILAARKGLIFIARSGFLFSVFHILFVIIFVAALLYVMNFENFLPVLTLNPISFYHGVSNVVALPFCDVVVFMMLLPYTQQSDRQQMPKAFIKGFSLGALMFLVACLLNIAVLGDAVEFFNFPQYEAIRLIEAEKGIGNLELLYGLMLISQRFFRTTLLLYLCSLTVAELCGLKTYEPLVFLLGLFASLVSLFISPGAAESADFRLNVQWAFSAVYTVLLPLVTLIAAVIRTRTAKKGVLAA